MIRHVEKQEDRFQDHIVKEESLHVKMIHTIMQSIDQDIKKVFHLFSQMYNLYNIQSKELI